MDQGNQSGNNNNNMMLMGQNGMGSQMGRGQSLDEIVNQNAKAIRRQSMPHQYSDTQSNMDTDVRRLSMMDYGSHSPAGPMGNFQFDPNAGMRQGGMMSGDTTPAQNQHQKQHQRQQDSHSRRQSHSELALNTSFANSPQGYSAMMPPNSAYQSPAQIQSGFDMTMESPYIESTVNMQMDYNVDQNLAEVQQMNMYNQPQFDQNMMSSPMHQTGSQSTPHSAQGQSQNPESGSGMDTSYAGRTHSSNSTVRQYSGSQSLHVPDTASPQNSGGVTPMSQNPSGPQQDYPHGGFQRQSQNPPPESAQDRGMHRNTGNSQYDGVNGPLPVNSGNYNPNNQGFNWDAGENGWPSTMVGRPHMQTSYKNAYSSTGFDMVGVLVRIAVVPSYLFT